MRTAVKLRVAFERATEETEETSAKVLASLGKIEEILRARGKETTTTTKTDESVSIERLLMEAELCQMLDRKREELEEREREVAARAFTSFRRKSKICGLTSSASFKLA